MVLRLVLRGACAAGLFALAGLVFASGSESFGSAQTSDTRNYHLGKSIYAEKFACRTCPLTEKVLDQAVAKDILNGKIKVALKEEEKAALFMYLKRRFNI
jgi:hypothetical protein